MEESRALSLFGKLLDQPDAETVAAHVAMASLSDPARIREVLHGWDDVTVAPVATETIWGRDAADAVDFIPSPARPAGRSTPTHAQPWRTPCALMRRIVVFDSGRRCGW